MRFRYEILYGAAVNLVNKSSPADKLALLNIVVYSDFVHEYMLRFYMTAIGYAAETGQQKGKITRKLKFYEETFTRQEAGNNGNS